MFMRKVSTLVVCENGNQPRFLSFFCVSSLLVRVDFYARSRISIPQLSLRIMKLNETLLVLYRFLGRALVTLLLKDNSRVGHLFSEKPFKCNTIKKYIFNDLFGSEIKIQSVKVAAYSIFRHLRFDFADHAT